MSVSESDMLKLRMDLETRIKATEEAILALAEGMHKLLEAMPADKSSLRAGEGTLLRLTGAKKADILKEVRYAKSKLRFKTYQI